MKKKLLNNWQLKLATLIFAFLFWRVIGEIADPITSETYYNIPVTMVNEEIVTDKGKVYQIENADGTVNVTVKAETSILRSIDESDIIATADFEEIELSELVPVSIEIIGYEGTYIEASTNPVNLKVVIEDSVSKKFPVVPSSVGTVIDGYALGTMTAEPETVVISGPQSLVDSIVRVEARVDISTVKSESDIEGELIFYDADNLEIDQSLLTANIGEEESVVVNVQILDTKSVQLSLDVSGEPEAGYQVVSVTAEPTEIVVAAQQEVLEELSVIEIPSSALDITGESGKVERVIDVSLYLPEDVQLYDQNNNSIAVTVQIDELGTKSLEIPVQSIVVYNNPEDLTLMYDSIIDITVMFYGIEGVIDELATSDVELSIDLESYDKAGSYTVPVTVDTSEEYDLVEEVEVQIILTES